MFVSVRLSSFLTKLNKVLPENEKKINNLKVAAAAEKLL
jgi:hypothetical protein